MEIDTEHVGIWGGRCLCPDGQEYLVGDNVDFCGSLACVGGLSGECVRAEGEWARRRVTCGVPMRDGSGGAPTAEFNMILDPAARTASSSTTHEGGGDTSGDASAAASRLESASGWVAEGQEGEWLTLDLGSAVSLVGIAMRPRADEPGDAVGRFEVHFTSVAGQAQPSVARNRGGGTVFEGPMPRASPERMVFALFDEPIRARLVTIRPLPWSGGRTGMRVGLLANHFRYQDIPGLTSAKCDGMIRDPKHLFRRMWAAEACAPPPMLDLARPLQNPQLACHAQCALRAPTHES